MGTSYFGLKIASWNANGVRSRTVELRDFIDKHHPDIILIQETHLGPGDTLHIPNFTTYRNDRPYTPNRSPRGGTAIIIKSSLSHTTHRHRHWARLRLLRLLSPRPMEIHY
ncbi:hypothetical protein TNCV_4907241 [Trichonephila clavipes]|uniref:Endonuclease/exonuclease/phosphatase domain-containing protein n=1 Tax=Trichonephila clavipes TaxID=2585209 RepID=A0A8X6RPA2_TRICX|nr:hypothetical protein TNCV_4907241 [Trichonephila clavipes]